MYDQTRESHAYQDKHKAPLNLSLILGLYPNEADLMRFLELSTAYSPSELRELVLYIQQNTKPTLLPQKEAKHRRRALILTYLDRELQRDALAKIMRALGLSILFGLFSLLIGVMGFVVHKPLLSLIALPLAVLFAWSANRQYSHYQNPLPRMNRLQARRGPDQQDASFLSDGSPLDE